MEIPDRVWKLFDREGAWTQGCFARDAEGEQCGTEDPKATMFCLLGGIELIYPPHARYDKRRVVMEKLKVFPRIGYLSVWNDDPKRTREEVVVVLKELDV